MLTLINFKNMKKFFSVALIVVFAFAGTANAGFVDDYAADLMLDELNPFNDVGETHLNRRAINHSYQYGIIEGYPDGTFGPDRPINRAELIKVMVYQILEGEPDPQTYRNCFSDVNEEWFAPYVCYALEQGWVQGYEDGTYRPGNPVNRVEALKIIMNIAIPEDQWPDPTDADMSVEMPVDIIEGQWYVGYARMAIVKELVDGQHVTQDSQGRVYYYPSDNMTRKEVVEMLWRITVWIVQRDFYAQAMAELGCAQIENPDMENYTDEEKNIATYKVFEIYGFDQPEADAAIGDYFYDTVGDSKIEYYAAEKCGPGVEYDNWIFANGIEGLDEIVVD